MARNSQDQERLESDAWLRAAFEAAYLEEMDWPNPPYHSESDCMPDPCPYHRPSFHRMNTWPTVLRASGLVERKCEHGIGHPDPDSLAWLIGIKIKHFGPTLGQEEGEAYGIHGCDGCCSHDQ